MNDQDNHNPDELIAFLKEVKKHRTVILVSELKK